MRVYTYHTQINALRDPDLLICWRDSWAKHGWEPRVLEEADATRASPWMCGELLASPLMRSCPGNPVEYTKAALLRWAAMQNIGEYCLHVDWDVICNGFRPEHMPNQWPGFTFMAGSTCPCAIAADARGWRLFGCLLFMAPYLPGFSAEALLKDSCDQYAASLFPPSMYRIQADCPCKLYQEQAGWEKAPMIHFATRVTGPNRSATVRRVGIV